MPIPLEIRKQKALLKLEEKCKQLNCTFIKWIEGFNGGDSKIQVQFDNFIWEGAFRKFLEKRDAKPNHKGLTKQDRLDILLEVCSSKKFKFLGFGGGATEYRDAKTRVLMECEQGHNWETGYYKITDEGTGCPYCAKNASYTEQEAIDLFHKNNPNIKFKGWVNPEFTSIRRKCNMECSCGHEWTAQFNLVMHNKKGCPKCKGGIVLSESEAIERIENKGFKFIKWHSDYKNTKSFAIVECSKGHQTLTRAKYITERTKPSCSYCSGTGGYRNIYPGKLYIMFNNTFVKVGITNRSVESRLFDINKSIKRKHGIDLNLNIYKYYEFSNGAEVRELETQTLKWLRENYNPVDIDFSGSTECFIGISPEELDSYISSLFYHK